jgi:lipoate-protein ligase A
MELLELPEKRPVYRQNRPHEDFLFPLRQTSLTPELFIERLVQRLRKAFEPKVCDYTSLERYLELPHRKTTGLEKTVEYSVF